MPETPRKTDCLSALAYRALVAILAGTVLSLAIEPSRAAEPTALKTLVVLPFEIQDTSGEVGPADRHDAMLGRLTALVRDAIAAGQLYRVQPKDLTDRAVEAVNANTFLRNCNGCEVDIAKRLNANYVLVGWIYKVSTLILALHVNVKDAMTGKTIYARAFDFRGDNDEAYARAAKALVRSLAEELPMPSSTPKGG